VDLWQGRGGGERWAWLGGPLDIRHCVGGSLCAYGIAGDMQTHEQHEAKARPSSSLTVLLTPEASSLNLRRHETPGLSMRQSI
jgi:hypothetical protein